jgi:peptidylprolyl isomerase
VDTGFPKRSCSTKDLANGTGSEAGREPITHQRKDFTVSASKPSSSLPPGTDPENALILETTRGDVVVALRSDVAPAHAERLKLLAREHFYDDVPFHRVIDGFMAQTGDGQHGNGTGGSKHPNLKSEFSDVPYKRGTVGMARTSNPHSANSQFFIMFEEGSFLNGQYTVVGEVVQGMDVVDKLKRGEPPSDPDRMVRVQVAADVKQ